MASIRWDGASLEGAVVEAARESIQDSGCRYTRLKIHLHIKTLDGKDGGIDISNHYLHGLSDPTTCLDTRSHPTNQGGSYVRRGWIRRLYSVRTTLLTTTQSF